MNFVKCTDYVEKQEQQAILFSGMVFGLLIVITTICIIFSLQFLIPEVSRLVFPATNTVDDLNSTSATFILYSLLFLDFGLLYLLTNQTIRATNFRNIRRGENQLINTIRKHGDNNVQFTLFHDFVWKNNPLKCINLILVSASMFLFFKPLMDKLGLRMVIDL